MDEPLESWFTREILAHEEALVRYLRRIWPRREELHDLRQETYTRVYESSMASRPLSPKSFLFTTARHLMADRIRRQRVVSIEAVGDLDVLNVLIDEISPEQRTGARQELKRLAHAFDLLPPKCREAVWLRRVDDLSQKEVADKLGISQRTVEKHVMKGMRLLADAVFGSGGDVRPDEAKTSESEPGHGKQHTD